VARVIVQYSLPKASRIRENIRKKLRAAGLKWQAHERYEGRNLDWAAIETVLGALKDAARQEPPLGHIWVHIESD
jgi:hypothetical protein